MKSATDSKTPDEFTANFERSGKTWYCYLRDAYENGLIGADQPGKRATPKEAFSAALAIAHAEWGISKSPSRAT